jgi:uncharacterized protein (DUF1501 family)
MNKLLHLQQSRRPALTLSSPLRRQLLKAFAASGLLAAVVRNAALAQAATDYKALVCIFLQGGNDGENTIIRNDTSGYASYAAVRTPASGINIEQKNLLPLQPANLSAPYGLHPSCSAMKTLFDAKKLAVVANMGMLTQPSSRLALTTQGQKRPASLFSHTDQELEMQSADATGFDRVGWGGRIADKLDPFNPGNVFPPLITTSGMKTFTAGRASIPLAVPNNPYFTLYSSGDNRYQYDVLRDAALREILSQPVANTYDLATQLLAEEGLAASSVVFPILKNDKSIVPPFFAHLSSEISQQLKTVAFMLEGRGQTKMKRQVFYSHQGGYDTHGGQAGIQSNLLRDLSDAMLAFQNVVEALGLGNSVIAFTLSDFGRTFKPATSGGTDHGWGNYAFVLGGAVKGGDFYGTLPSLMLNGPDDVSDAGRWIPTTSLEQYAAPMVRWLGIAETDIPYVLPNIGAFGAGNVAFMR